MKPTFSTDDDFRTDVEQTRAIPPSEQRSGSSDDALIEKLCHHFDQDWKNGRPPRLDEYINEFKAAGPDRLFAKLLEIELNHRVAIGELPLASGYCRLLPQYAETIDRCFKSRQVESYFLGEKLGEGGMGTVYKAIHVQLGRLTALKVILGDRGADRFLSEMKALGPLSHINIVRAEHAGDSQQGLFLAMELIDGANLADLVKTHGPLPAPIACELVRQVAAGLQYIHQHGRVHRDIKPQNLMLDSNGNVKVLDLGLARWRDADDQCRTQSGLVFGTVDYMPPEQFNNSKDVDIRGDIYSLGCTLYFLLSGKPPFSSPGFKGYASKMYAHVNVPAPDIRDITRDVPPHLAAIINKALAKSPDERYQTPREFGAALAPLAAADGLPQLLLSPSQRTERSSEAAHAVTASDVRASLETHRSNPTATGQSAGPSRVSRRMLAGVAASLAVVAIIAAFALIDWSPGRVRPLAPALRRSLATQQGPSGVWWFDEIPQFNPILRRCVFAGPAKQAEELRTALATQDHSEIVARLQNFAKANQQLSPSEESQGLITIGLNSSQDDAESKSDFLRRLQVIRSVLIGLQPALAEPASDATSDIRPEYLHFFAVVTHKIASLDEANSAQLFEQAAFSYQHASANYLAAQELDLLSLCRADLARCAVDQGDNITAATLFESAESTTRAIDLPFSLYTLCCKAEAHYQSQHRSEARLAIEAADGLLTPDAPPALQALVREQSGWLHMERWAAERNPLIREQELADAEADFAKAETIRRALCTNDASLMKWFHNRHGRALVDQYAGRTAESMQAFEALVEELQAATNDREKPPHTRILLHARLLNSRERMAECHLSGQTPDHLQAIEIYSQAAADGKKYLIDSGLERPLVTQILCKQSISESLSGQKPAASKSLSTAKRLCKDLLTEQRDDKQLLIDVAEALRGAQPEAQIATSIQTSVASFLEKHKEGLSRDQHRVLELVYTQLKLDLDTLHH